MKIGKTILILIFTNILYNTSAQDSLSKKILRDKNILALPVVFRYPETRWGGGVAGLASFGFRKDSVGAKMSQLNFGVTFTQNKQVLVFFPFRIFMNNNKYYLFSENGWYKFNYVYSGVGENRVPDEKYDTEYLRLRLLAAQLIRPQTYLGLRLNIEDYKVTGTVAGGELASGTINGSDASRIIGLGVSLLKDSRDNVFYPTRGTFSEFFLVPSSRIFGANRNFVKIVADIAVYHSITPKTVWANQVYISSNIGDVPFNQMVYLGGQFRMRGIFEGYFRDKNAAILQTEVRQKVWKIFGVAGFGSLGFMGDENQFMRLNKPKYTYGAGLRIATKNKLNLRLDYALSPYGNGAFYATVGEAF